MFISDFHFTEGSQNDGGQDKDKFVNEITPDYYQVIAPGTNYKENEKNIQLYLSLFFQIYDFLTRGYLRGNRLYVAVETGYY